MLKERLYIFCIIFLILILCLDLSSASAFQFGSEWNEYTSEHFLIYSHPSIPGKYIGEFAKKCEHYYHLIAERLGFSRFRFWLWDERAKVFIYQSRQDYLARTGQPEWSAGSAQSRAKIIETFYFEKDFFDAILPHELAHIILKEFVGFDTRVPLWFEEGVACANEKDSRKRYLLLAQGLAEKKTIMTVARMEELGWGIPESPAAFYATSAALVIFLIDDYGKDNFARFCRQLRDGSSFYGAMAGVYGIKDARDLDGKFLAFLKKKE